MLTELGEYVLKKVGGNPNKYSGYYHISKDRKQFVKSYISHYQKRSPVPEKLLWVSEAACPHLGILAPKPCPVTWRASSFVWDSEQERLCRRLALQYKQACHLGHMTQ